MNKAFEKILERLEEEKSDWNYDYNVPIIKAKEIVQEVAEEYKKETYFNLDNVTLHKCPKCGGNAQHRVNQKGSWACGCFECGLFKSDYDHQKAIQEWEDYCKEYNNGWIPCSERLPEIRQDCLVTVRYTGFMGMHGFWVKTGHMEAENDWWGDCSGGEVIAWQPLTEPYKERD